MADPTPADEYNRGQEQGQIRGRLTAIERQLGIWGIRFFGQDGGGGVFKELTNGGKQIHDLERKQAECPARAAFAPGNVTGRRRWRLGLVCDVLRLLIMAASLAVAGLALKVLDTQARAVAPSRMPAPTVTSNDGGPGARAAPGS